MQLDLEFSQTMQTLWKPVPKGDVDEEGMWELRKKYLSSSSQ